jgi:hypothetical protein
MTRTPLRMNRLVSSSPELCEERESVVPGMSMANERSSGLVTVGQLDPKRGAIL